MKTETSESKYVQQDKSGNIRITPTGNAYLKNVVTNVSGNVYSFSQKFDPTIIAAAMARLSRFGGDMRELLLKEFADQGGQEEALLRRILTQFGDDSVQQLGMVPVVVENASNILTKQLEWGRLAAYLEQSTRYIYYDVKREGHYRYYVPDHLPSDLLQRYRTMMDEIFANYAQLVHKMTDYYYKLDTTPESDRDASWRIAMRGKACDAARGLLPAATTSTVGIVGSGQAIDNLIMHLLSQDLPEARQVGQDILKEVRKTHAIFFERTDMENRGIAQVEYKRQNRQRMAILAAKFAAVHPPRKVSVAVKLLEYTPHDELELLTHMLFAHVTMSFEEVQTIVSTWSDEEKQAAFELYMGERGNRRHKPGRALEIAHYSFELVSDYGSFRDLQRHRMVDALEWQLLSPFLGYDVPEAVSDAGFEALYRETHSLSQALYKDLVDAGYRGEAQYATLLSDKLRWKLTFNAREAFHFIELRTQPAGHPGYRKLVQQMYDAIAAVHPHLAAAMIFVNRTDDNPMISRLEQSRQAAAKLKKLGLAGLIE